MTMMSMPGISEELAKKIPNLLSKLYYDTLHPAAKEIGFVLRDIAKTFSVLSYPFMQGAAFKDRLSEKVFKIVETVPENLRVMPYPQFFLEYLDKTKFIPDGSAVLKSFDCLLSSSVNRDKRNLVHPAFLVILAQLSSDEIFIINKLKYEVYKLKERHHFNFENRKFYQTDIIENQFPIDILYNKDLFFMYCNHLNKLDITNFPQTARDFEKDSHQRQTAEIKTFTLMLTEFGKLFSQVCCAND